MNTNILEKLFAHNNWANDLIIQACLSLSDEQLDAAPHSATMGTIRDTLIHLVAAQHNYLALLTLPIAERQRISPTMAELQPSAAHSGAGLLALARDPSGFYAQTQLQTRDNHLVEPSVIMVQVINHASEHREQLCSMLSALGITPPDMDGWSYGEATQTLTPIPT
ncbi:MAG: hypothetical protein KJ069_14525 [Anaerolineae bacterium]|nr:hypothetical protein [Anaerolineae bacterium]